MFIMVTKRVITKIGVVQQMKSQVFDTRIPFFGIV